MFVRCSKMTKPFHESQSELYFLLLMYVCCFSGGGEGSGWGALVGPPAGWSVGVGRSADGDH